MAESTIAGSTAAAASPTAGSAAADSATGESAAAEPEMAGSAARGSAYGGIRVVRIRVGGIRVVRIRSGSTVADPEAAHARAGGRRGRSAHHAHPGTARRVLRQRRPHSSPTRTTTACCVAWGSSSGSFPELQSQDSPTQTVGGRAETTLFSAGAARRAHAQPRQRVLARRVRRVGGEGGARFRSCRCTSSASSRSTGSP